MPMETLEKAEFVKQNIKQIYTTACSTSLLI